jgi:hypothetical protein
LLKSRLQTARDLLAKCELCANEIRDLESKVDGLLISRERVIFGIAFAILPCISSIAVLLTWINTLFNERYIVLRDQYIAFTPVCSVCAVAAYGLLGRRKTNESQFIDDLKRASMNIELLTATIKQLVP